jgi:hypothetical protein
MKLRTLVAILLCPNRLSPMGSKLLVFIAAEIRNCDLHHPHLIASSITFMALSMAQK